LKLKKARYIISSMIETMQDEDPLEGFKVWADEHPNDYNAWKQHFVSREHRIPLREKLFSYIGTPEKVAFLNGSTTAAVVFVASQSSIYGILAGGAIMGISYGIASFFQGRTKNPPQQN